MQIVIDIEKKDYDMICGYSTEYIQSIFSEAEYRAVTAIRKGTPLPKGHGRLIDADALECDYFNRISDDYSFDCIDNAPTIIEADKEELDADSN